MTIYRIKGTSRQPVATANASGDLGCFESECKHLTFYLKPGAEKVKKIKFTVAYSQISSKCNPRA